MLVKVTKQDIEKGVARSSGWCPIAQSLRRAGYCNIRVAQDYIVSNDKTYRLSAAAQKFIAHFDTDRPVKPAAFLIKGLARPRAE
jgi:hypothetical protein